MMAKRDEVIIVSGLPRSGTSMLMKMLSAGGCPIVSDDVRKPDSDNPNGYFECKDVMSLAQDNTIIRSANGKAIKVVSPLLQHLPDDLYYRVIFVHRSLGEVIASQQKMLVRNGKVGADTTELRRSFAAHIAFIERWLSQQSHFKVMYLRYVDIVNHPTDTAKEMCLFLERELTMPDMVAAVDRKLYRNTCGAKVLENRFSPETLA